MSIFDSKTGSSPFSTGDTGGIFGNKSSGSRGSSSIFSDNGVDLEVNDQLQFLAEQNGYQEKKSINALERAARILNLDIAAIAGAAIGMMDPKKSVFEGIKFGLEENIGFREVLKEIVGTPSTRTGKVLQGTTGFAADIFLSPLTYLTFGTGAGLKIAAKEGAKLTLNKGATKLFNQASTQIYKNVEPLTKAASIAKDADLKASSIVQEAIDTGSDLTKAKEKAQTVRTNAKLRYHDFIAEGVDPIRAERLAKTEAKREADILLQKFVAGKVTPDSFERFIKAGVNIGTLEAMAQLGPKILDKGGIKMFGQTLVTSKALANTPIGKAARSLNEKYKFGEVVKAITEPLGRAFIFNFGANKEVQEHLRRMGFETKRAAAGLSLTLDEVFKNTTEAERVELFDGVLNWRKRTVDKAIEIQNSSLDDIKKLFPDLVVRNPEEARTLIETVGDDAAKEIGEIRKNIDDILKPYFDNINTGKIGDKKATINKLKAMLKDLRQARGSIPALGKTKTIGEVEINKEVLDTLSKRLTFYEEERLQEIIDKLSTKIEKIRETPTTAGVKAGKGVKASPAEEVVASEKAIQKIQDDLTKKTELLTKVAGARRAAKELMRSEKLTFENKKIQKISDFLFEGDNSYMSKVAKIAGLSEADTFKYYLPSKFEDYVKVKGFKIANRLSSVKLDSMKLFNGIEGDGLSKDAAKAAKQAAVETVTARIRSDYVKAFFNKGAVGRKFDELDEARAKELGYELFERDLLGEKFKGWLPKAIAKDIKAVLEPGDNIINDLAKITGFDYATGLFKGWVTSLFPAFHFRNYTSNQFLGMIKFGMDWFNPAAHKEAVSLLLGRNPNAIIKTATGKSYTQKELLKEVKKYTNFLDSTAFDSVEQMIEEVGRTARSFPELTKQINLNPLSRTFTPIQAGRLIGTDIENYSKMTAMLISLKQGKSVKDAIKDAEEVIFNYQALTPFEKDFMRRIIPFYTWARKNFELQLRTLASSPGKTAMQFKFMGAMGDSLGEPYSEDDTEGLPPWLADSFGIKTNVFNSGKTSVMTGFGHPLEEFFGRWSGENGFLWNGIKNTLTMANPLVKYPLEYTTGIDMFRGKPITELSNAGDIAGMIEMMGPVGDEFAELINFKKVTQPRYVDGKSIGEETKYYANPYFLHFFRNLPTARASATLSLSPTERQNPDQWLLKTVTGLQVTEIDKQKQEFFNELNRRKELVNFLEQLGIVGKKDVLYMKDAVRVE